MPLPDERYERRALDLTRAKRSGPRRLGPPLKHKQRPPSNTPMALAQSDFDGALEAARNCYFEEAVNRLAHGISVGPTVLNSRTPSVQGEIDKMRNYFQRCDCRFIDRPKLVGAPRNAQAGDMMEEAENQAHYCDFNSAMALTLDAVKEFPQYYKNMRETFKDDVSHMKRSFENCRCRFKKPAWER